MSLKKLIKYILVKMLKVIAKHKYYKDFFGFIYKTAYKVNIDLAYFIRGLLTRWILLAPEHLLGSKELDESFALADPSPRTFFSGSTDSTSSRDIRIGFFDPFSVSLIYNESFWKNIPEGVQVFLYDLKFSPDLPSLDSLKDLPYLSFSLNTTKIFPSFNKYKHTFDHYKLASAVNNDKLDFFLVTLIGSARFSYSSLFDMLAEPTKIIVLNIGSYPLFHPRISMFGQPQLPPFWTIENGKLKGRWSKKIVVDGYLFDHTFFCYNLPKIIFSSFVGSPTCPHGSLRENLIFVYGQLMKFCSLNYLKIVAELLKEDSSRKFIFMGPYNDRPFKEIISFFRREGVLKQVEYEGAYNLNSHDSALQKWQNYLRKATVFLNPFPLPAGNARIEAFAAGLPVIEMGVPSSPSQKCWLSSSLLAAEKKRGVAYSLKEYLQLSRKVFYDTKYREELISEQVKVCHEFCYPQRFWKKIIKVIQNWHQLNGS